ncbi:unnamed protein product [Pedinophyceae sp. YPF-701]|nr:unnamed protein product [Pedinophyceae sp. YPF-701]
MARRCRPAQPARDDGSAGAGAHAEAPRAWLVILKLGASEHVVAEVCANAANPDVHDFSGACRRVFRPPGPLGFSATLTTTDLAAMAMRFRRDIDFIEEDGEVALEDPGDDSESEDGAAEHQRVLKSAGWSLRSWWLEMIGLDAGVEARASLGRGVTLYVLDTGVRSDHDEFATPGGGSRVLRGWDANDLASNDPGNIDCHGHGTHVASLAAGRTVGVAPGAWIVPVRVFTGCRKIGTMETLLAGLESVAAHATLPAVVVLSLDMGARRSIDIAVRALLALGVTVVTAAGNSGSDACLRSPARVPGAVTVGAIDVGMHLYRHSNWGPCVDVVAPGVRVWGADMKSTQALSRMTGTSMACPIVAGVAALQLAQHPTLSPEAVRINLLTSASRRTPRHPAATTPPAGPATSPPAPPPIFNQGAVGGRALRGGPDAEGDGERRGLPEGDIRQPGGLAGHDTMDLVVDARVPDIITFFPDEVHVSEGHAGWFAVRVEIAPGAPVESADVALWVWSAWDGGSLAHLDRTTLRLTRDSAEQPLPEVFHFWPHRPYGGVYFIRISVREVSSSAGRQGLPPREALYTLRVLDHREKEGSSPQRPRTIPALPFAAEADTGVPGLSHPPPVTCVAPGQASGPSGSPAAVFYSFTPSIDTQVHVSTCGSVDTGCQVILVDHGRAQPALQAPGQTHMINAVPPEAMHTCLVPNKVCGRGWFENVDADVWLRRGRKYTFALFSATGDTGKMHLNVTSPLGYVPGHGP